MAGKALYDSGIGKEYIEPLAEKVWLQMETKLDRRGEVGSGAETSSIMEVKGLMAVGIAGLLARL